MSTTPILVLYHRGEPSRDRAWSHCRSWWESEGFTVVEGASPRGLYAARNAAADAAGDWEAAVFVDADILPGSAEQVHEGLRLALANDSYCCLYDVFHYLGVEETEAVIAGKPLSRTRPDGSLYGTWIGAFAISRRLWEEVGGGFEERTRGRAGQDIAFIYAVSILGCKQRLSGPVFHFWHEPATGRVRDDVWTPRYKDAHDRIDVQAMEDLVKGVRE